MLTFADKIKIVCNVQSERCIFMYNAQLTYDRIDEMSKLRGISIGKINEICSLSKNAISNAAKSEYGMKAKNIVLISEILDVSTDYLLGRTDNPNVSGNNIIQSSNVINGNNGNHSPLTVTETEKENNCKKIEAFFYTKMGVLFCAFMTTYQNYAKSMELL